MTTKTAAVKSVSIEGVLFTAKRFQAFVERESWISFDPENITFEDVAKYVAEVEAKRLNRSYTGYVQADGWSEDREGEVVSEQYWIKWETPVSSDGSWTRSRGYLTSITRGEVKSVKALFN